MLPSSHAACLFLDLIKQYHVALAQGLARRVTKREDNKFKKIKLSHAPCAESTHTRHILVPSARRVSSLVDRDRDRWLIVLPHTTDNLREGPFTPLSRFPFLNGCPCLQWPASLGAHIRSFIFSCPLVANRPTPLPGRRALASPSCPVRGVYSLLSALSHLGAKLPRTTSSPMPD